VAQRLAVGVAGLEARGDQILPDQRQLLHARAEQVDALGAVIFVYRPYFLATSPSTISSPGAISPPGTRRDDRIRAVLLQVGEGSGSFVSCSGACLGFRIISVPAPEAKIDARAGLQMSQPGQPTGRAWR